ncbi:hypothetical protein QFZ20_002123 [Flavobacterium sp. W4I14]|nr:hypothetical protein [Flavobacterium sp. W4I14]
MGSAFGFNLYQNYSAIFAEKVCLQLFSWFPDCHHHKFYQFGLKFLRAIFTISEMSLVLFLQGSIGLGLDSNRLM